MSKLRWSTLYKPAPAGYQKIRKIAQERTFEHQGDLLTVESGGRALLRLNEDGEEIYELGFYEKPDQILIDEKNRRLVTRDANIISSYDLLTGARGPSRHLNGRHRREMFLDADGQIHVEEGRSVFTFDANLQDEKVFKAPFTTCYTGRHHASESWVFERAEPKGVLVTDEQGEPLYRSDRELELLDPGLKTFMLLEEDDQGRHLVRPNPQGELVSFPAPNTVAALPGSDHKSLLVGVSEAGTTLKVLNSDGSVEQSFGFPGGPKQVFSTDEYIYVLTGQDPEPPERVLGERFRRPPTTHRLLRMARDGSSAEQLYQGVHQGRVFGAVNASGHLLLQTADGVLELDAQGQGLATHSNPHEVNDRELVSRPHTTQKYFGDDTKEGWFAFAQAGIDRHNYPAPYETANQPYLSREGCLNFPESIDGQQLTNELAAQGLDEPEGFVATGQRFLPFSGASQEEAAAQNRVMDHFVLGGDGIYAVEDGKRPENRGYIGRDDKLTTYLPLKGDYRQYLATGMEDGRVQLSGWVTTRYDIGSPVKSLTAQGDRLLATGDDGSYFVQPYFEELHPPEPSLVEDLQLFQHWYESIPKDKKLPAHALANRVFDATRAQPESQRKQVGQRALGLFSRFPGEQALAVAELVQPTSVLQDLDGLERFLEMVEPSDSFVKEFSIYRAASQPKRDFLDEFVKCEQSLVGCEELLPQLEMEFKQEHLKNLHSLREHDPASMWSNYKLVLSGPGRGRPAEAVEALLKLNDLHSAQDKPGWSVANAFRTLMGGGGGPDEVDRYGHLLATHGAQALDVALMAENKGKPEIDFSYEPDFLEVGDHLVGRD